jgi:hypothetical protein
MCYAANKKRELILFSVIKSAQFEINIYEYIYINAKTGIIFEK